MAGSWGNIPPELLQRPQWCLAHANGAPLSVKPTDESLYNASVTTPAQWLQFQVAAHYAVMHGLHVGFVLQAGGGLTCADLDVVDAASQERKGKPVDPSKWSTQVDFERYWHIVNTFQTYTERSRHGKGLHLWLLNEIGRGRRRDNVEIYSQERFIITTGDPVLLLPMGNRGELLTLLLLDMERADLAEPLLEIPARDIDEVVWARAAHAENGAKFIALCNGEWQSLVDLNGNPYPSQSEADNALMSMFTFYSQSNDQCRRMFRASKLGQRDKAAKDDRYLNITLSTIRTRQSKERARLLEGQLAAERILNNQPIAVPGSDPELDAMVRRMQGDRAAHEYAQRNVPGPQPTAPAMAMLESIPDTNDDGLPWPPGIIGHLAWWYYQNAPRPVREVAIIAALGFFAGVCGKAYNVNGLGLNLYLILVALSGVGKEALHSSTSALIGELMVRCPGAAGFVNWNEPASGQALIKTVTAQPSQINLCGEWGKKLKRLANDASNDTAMHSLRATMLNLYQKSDRNAIVGGISYSNQEQNVMAVQGASYSMMGETTPGTLFESLTQGMMEDGFLSRFNIVVYAGDRPNLNRARTALPSALAESLGLLCEQSMRLNQSNGVSHIGFDEAGHKCENDFELYATARVRETKVDARRQMWNRAHLKVLRLAGLCAVGENYVHPVVQLHHVEWAKDMVLRDIKLMTSKLDDGDVGNDDNARVQKLNSLATKYIDKLVPPGYRLPQNLIDAGVVPIRFFNLSTSATTSFTTHKLGHAQAVELTLKTLVANGTLLPLDKKQVQDTYNYNGGQCYRVLMRE